MRFSRRRTLKNAIQRIAPEAAFQHLPRGCICFGCVASLALLMVLWIGLSGGAEPSPDVMSARSSEAPSLLIFSSGVVEADSSRQTRPRAEAVWNIGGPEVSPEGLTPLLVELVVVAGQHVRALPDTEPFNLSVPQPRLTSFVFRSQSRPSLTRVGWGRR